MIGRRPVAPRAVTAAHAPWSALRLLAGLLLVADVVRLVGSSSRDEDLTEVQLVVR